MNLQNIRNYKFLLKPHYFFNLLLAASFFVLKNVPHICDSLFESCAFEMVSNDTGEKGSTKQNDFQISKYQSKTTYLLVQFFRLLCGFNNNTE